MRFSRKVEQEELWGELWGPPMVFGGKRRGCSRRENVTKGACILIGKHITISERKP